MQAHFMPPIQQFFAVKMGACAGLAAAGSSVTKTTTIIG
jgi:hypothetical protein